MQIASLFQKNRPVFSLEIFPPKRIGPIDTIYKTLDNLKDLQPDFISVTYGAGGNAGDTTTADIAGNILNRYGILPLAHLTCVIIQTGDRTDTEYTKRKRNKECSCIKR